LADLIYVGAQGVPSKHPSASQYDADGPAILQFSPIGQKSRIALKLSVDGCCQLLSFKEIGNSQLQWAAR